MNLEIITWALIAAGLSAAGIRFGSVHIGGVSGSAAAVLLVIGVLF